MLLPDQAQHEPHRFRPDRAGAARSADGERWVLFGDLIASDR
jgi:hypothetical protein